MAVFDGFLAMHAANVGWDEIHGTGAEQGDHGDDILDCGGLHLHEPAAHAAAFHLEYTGGLTPAQ